MRLRDYDVVEISSSGGKDSQAMVFHVAALLRSEGISSRGVVMHADMGRADWPGTPDLAREQAEAAGLRFLQRARPQGDLYDDWLARGKFSTPTQRFCTSDHKRGQLLVLFTRVARALAEERADRGWKKRPIRILNCIGLRAEESPARASAPPFQARARGTTRTTKQVDIWLPIHDWSEARVWEAVRASGAPVHPAYAAGFPRASCRLCIYMGEQALLAAGEMFPEALDHLVGVERLTGHRFKNRLSLASIQRRLQGGEKHTEIESWAM